MYVLNIGIFAAHICPPGTYIKLKLAILLSVVMDIEEKVEHKTLYYHYCIQL